MSSEPSPEGSGAQPTEAPVVSPAVRRRLQQCYEHAKKLMAQPKYDHDYANTALTDCVVSDPGNLVYVEAFLDNLNKKYNHNLKGASMQMFLPRGPVKKALAAKQWQAAIKAGAAVLKINPWDSATLRAMAQACEQLQCNETELRYLKNAIDGSPKDVDVARHCANSLARVGQYDQAIACWARVAEIKKNDPEALKMIGDLQVEKTKWKFGMLKQDEKTKRPVATKAAPSLTGKTSDLIQTPRPAAAPPPEEPEPAPEKAQKRDVPLTTCQRLERVVQDDPTNIDAYLQLSDAYADEGKLAEAERALQRGLAATGNDLRIVDRLEEVHILKVKQQLVVAERRAKSEPTDAAKELVKQFKENLNRLELDVYGKRSERYPKEDQWKYELAVRLKRAANYSEALKRLAEIGKSSSLAAAALVESGECLQYLKQYQRAMEIYQRAIDLAQATNQSEQLKLALYRGGVLAAAMHQDAGRTMLTRLVGLDPTYRDARQRLEKLAAAKA
jgi:tetratricopeptide (TPR) repeat protein